MSVVFADLEAVVVDYLSDALAAYALDWDFAASVHVSIQVPNPRIDRMVIMRRDAGRQLDPARESARFGLQVWGSDFGECLALTNLVRALLCSMPDGDPVLSYSEVLAPVPVDDPSGQPMRYGTFELTARGADLAAPSN